MKAVIEGQYSDPPDDMSSVCCRKTDDYGRPMTGKNGLTLYRSLRGTSLLESMHQKLTKAFGHTMAGVLYSDCLLAWLRHRINWRASECNRPDFPQVQHYDGLLIDAVDELHEFVFGERKYANWDSSDKYMVRLSPYCIVPLDKEGPVSRHVDPVKGLTKSLHYLSLRQGSNVPYTPVKTPEEKKLFNQLVSQLLQENKRLSRDDTFEELTQRWNQIATGSNNIYCKYAQQLRSYYKLWKKTKRRKDAVSATDEKMLRAVLEHVPKLLRSEKLRESRVLASEPTAASHPSRSLTDNLEKSVGKNVDSTDEGVDASEAPVQHQQSMAQL